MKSETLINAGIGVTGTLAGFISSEKVGIAAGLATAAWMIWQLCCSIYDRLAALKDKIDRNTK